MVSIMSSLRDKVLSLFVKHRSLTPLKASNLLNIGQEEVKEVLEDLAMRGYVHKRDGGYYLTEAGEKAVERWGKGRWWIFVIILGESRKSRSMLKNLGFLKLVDRVWFAAYSETLFEKVRSLDVEVLISKSKIACEIWDKHHVDEKIKGKFKAVERKLSEAERLIVKRNYSGLGVDVLTRLRSIFLQQCEIISMLEGFSKPKNIKHVLKRLVPKLDSKLKHLVSRLINLFSLVDLDPDMSEVYNLYLELSSFQDFLRKFLGEKLEEKS